MKYGKNDEWWKFWKKNVVLSKNSVFEKISLKIKKNFEKKI